MSVTTVRITTDGLALPGDVRDPSEAAADRAVGGAPVIPVVGYLELDSGGRPHLRATECTECSARYLDRRTACARCFGGSFRSVRLAETGRLRSFTVVHRSSPGVSTPYVSCVVDLDDGAVVKANLLGVPPDPEAIAATARVRLTSFVAGVDSEGTRAVAFAFEPA